MRRMEKQAAKTMAAIEGVGHAQDHTSKSSAAKNLEQTEKTMKNVERSSRRTGGALKGLDSDMKRTDRSSGGLLQKLTRLSGGAAVLRVALSGVGKALMGLGFSVLAQAVGTLAGGLVALVPALVSAGGAVAALPATIGAAIQGFLGFKAAISGVGDAVKAGMDLNQQGAKVAQDTAKMHQQAADQQRQAAEAVRGAQHGVVMAHRGVRSAEEGLTQAYRNSRDAQREVTEARRQARRELLDLSLAAEGAALSQRRADLSLRQARSNLSQKANDPTTSPLDMDMARLDVAEAQLQRKQSRVDRRRSVEDRNQARRRGVAGNPQVVSAMRQAEDAQRGIRDAAEGVTDAMYSQGEAARQLADAQRNVARVTHDNAVEQANGVSAVSKYNEALAKLSPAAQRFVRRLISLRDTFKSVRQAAQESAFPGFNRALTSGLRGVPMARRLAGRTGRTIGDGTAGIAKRLTTTNRLSDIEGIGNQQASILAKMFKGFGNLSEALIDFMHAAAPFTDWMTDTVLGWTKLVEVNARFGRESGATAAALSRSRTALERFGRITRNLWIVLKEVLRAATPLGERLWDGAERATDGWARYVQTIEGSRKIEDWFNKLYDPLHELGQLTKALAKGWARITVSPGFTGSVRSLRRAVPSLEKLMKNLAGLGPDAADALGEIVKLLANLPFQPVRLVLKALTTMLRILNALVERFPALGAVLSAALAIGTLSKAVEKMAKFLKYAKEAVLLQNLSPGGWFGGGGGGGRGGPSRVARTARSAGSWARGGLDAATRTITGGFLASRAGQWLMRGRTGAALARIPGAGLSQLMGRGAGRAAAGGLLRGAGGLGLKLAGGVGIASTIAKTAGWEDADPLRFLRKADVGPKAARVNRLLKDMKGNVSQLILAGDVSKLKAYDRRLEHLGWETGGKAKKGIDALRRSLGRATTAARNVKFADKMTGELLKARTITRHSMSKLLANFSRLSPGARTRARRAMVAMARQLEASGELPKHSAARLNTLLLAKFNGLRAGARRRAIGFMKGLVDGIRTGSKGLGGMLTHVAGMFQAAVGGAKTVKGLMAAVTKHPDKIFGAGIRYLQAGGGNAGNVAAFGPGPAARMAKGKGPILGPRTVNLQNKGQVRRFQRQEHLTPDGIPGPATQRALARRARQGYAAGGVVQGSGHGDSVPAMLEPGEFVMRKRAVRRHGVRRLAAMNHGQPGAEGRPRKLPALDSGPNSPVVQMRRTTARVLRSASEADKGTRSTYGRLRKGVVRHTAEMRDEVVARFWQTRRRTGRAVLDLRDAVTARMLQSRRNAVRHARITRDDVTTHHKKMAKNVDAVGNGIRKGVDKDWKVVKKNIVQQAKAAKVEVGTWFDKLRSEAVRQMTAMGISRTEANKAVTGKGGKDKKALGGRIGFAGGGRIGGQGLADTVPVAPNAMAAPGEMIVNRHTERRLDNKLAAFGTSLSKEVKQESRPHSAPVTHDPRTGAERVPGNPNYLIGPGAHTHEWSGGDETQFRARMALGGRTQFFAKGGYSGTVPGLHPVIDLAHQKFGLGLISGRRNTITSSGNPSDHNWGGAADLSNGSSPTPGMDGFNRFAKTRLPGLVKQLIWRNKDQFKGWPIGGHMNHVHFAIKHAYANQIGRVKEIIDKAAKGIQFGSYSGGGDDAAQAIAALKPPKSRLGGAPGAMSNRASSVMADQMTKKVNERLGASAGGSLAGFKGGGSAHANMVLGRKMMLAFGYPAAQWPALKQLWIGESGWDNKITNKSSGAAGIPQALPASKMGPKAVAGDAAAQIAWGLKYIKGRYKTPSAALAAWRGRSPHWYESGGRVPEWGGSHGRGGKFTVSKPTMFEAGDKGRSETVQITPKGHTAAGPGGGKGVTVHIGTIHYGAAGDLREAIKKELEQVADDIAMMGAQQ